MPIIKSIQTLDVYFFSVLVLVLISIKTVNSSNRKTPQARVFSLLLVLNFLIICADCITILFDGVPGLTSRIFLVVASTFGYCLQVLICLFWFWYARAVIFPDRKLAGAITVIQGIPAFLCVVAAIISYRTGWIFLIDGQNHYHRGFFFDLIPAVSFLYLALCYYMILRYRKNIEKRHFVALLSFVLPPTVGGIIQTLLYGVILLWPSMTISLLIIYLAIQNELLLLDHLTGINNRRGFDEELRRRIVNAKSEVPFALLLLDINNFRSINDRYGHIECDEALKTLAKILVFCFLHDGFVCRYGGDEFAVIVTLKQLQDMDSIRQRLQARIDTWNAASDKSWSLSVSIGLAPFMVSEGLNQDGFLVKVDRLLTLDKIVPGDRRIRGRRGL
jgi:diguanylate cyclase (GGDEF)-like protein